MVKTTIIISELTKEQTISIPNIIKSQIHQYQREHNLDADIIKHWTELPGLSRLVIMFENEDVAAEIFNQLKANHEDLKIYLSEHILRRHNSDPSLKLKVPRSPSPEKYHEPEPVYQADAHVSSNETKLLLESLVLDTSKLDEKTRTQRSNSGTLSPTSPSITLEQVSV